MNLLVSVTESQAGQDVELRFLEDLLNDDCKCESLHTYTAYCSGEAAYRVTDCRSTRNVCDSTVSDPAHGTIARMKPGQRCISCLHLASECWEIRPI